MKFQPKRLAGYSESDLIQEIRRVVDECGGTVPSLTAFFKAARVSLPTIQTRFGSYAQAIQKAGFNYKDHRDKYTPERIKADLCEVLSRAGGYKFTYQYYRKNGGNYSNTTIKSALGLNWDDALAAIGAKDRPRIVHTSITAHAQRLKAFANLTKNDLFKEIDHVWQEKGRRPTYAEFRRSSKYGMKIYERQFNGWRNAVTEFSKSRGLRIQGQARTWATKEVLLDELRVVQRQRPNELLDYAFYKTNGGTYSIGTFQAHFGSWTNAVQAVGNISGKQARYSKDELFDELQRLWEQFGHQPTGRELSKHGKISENSFTTVFGTWTKAIHAFCEDRNSEAALTPLPFSESLSSVQVPKEPEKKEFPVVIPSTESATLIIVHKTSRQVPKRLRWRVFARDNFICQDCGRSPSKHGIALEADHKTAWTNGGETVFENLRTLCEDCNKGKSNL